MAKVQIEPTPSDAECESGRDRRRTPRTDLVVRVDYSTVDELFSEFTRDVNEGGLFIETEKPRPNGTEVSMQFHLPGSDGVIQTTGHVVHSTSGDDSSPPGMGIEFEELSDAARDQINALIRALRSDGP